MAAATTRTVKAKFDGDAKGLVAAAKEGERAIDKFGKDAERNAQKSGEKTGKGFGAGIKKWFRGEGGGLFSEIGKSGGTVFGSGLLGALKTPILGPAILASFAAIAATVMPAAGAIAAGGLVTGVGAGLAGLGLVFAAKSEAVQKKWQATMAQLGADMRLLARPFERTLINIADIFEDTVDAFNPHLARAFDKMAAPVERFVDDASDALEELIPAIDPITDAFNAVLDSLGPAMPAAIREVAAGMSDLAASVRENPDALADTVVGIGKVTRTALDLIATLNDVNGKFEQLTGGVSLVDATFAGLQATMAPLVGLFKGLEKGVGLVNAMTSSTEASGASMRDAALHVGALAEQYQKTGSAAKGTVAPVEDAAKATAEAKRKAAEAKAAFEGLVAAMFATQNMALSLSGAQISLQDAIDSAAASVKQNGRTLDINTEKGRANRTALNNLAQAANQQTEAMVRSGKSNVTTAKTAEQSRANFVKLARQMGATKPQAEAMAKAMIAIPNVTRTAKLNANKKDLETKLAQAQRELKNPNLTKERRAKLTANIANARAGIAEINRALGNLPSSRTVTLTTRMVTERIVRTQTAAGGGHAPGHASGGLVQPRRQYLVGERGPEILELGGTGGRIHSNEALNAIAPARQSEPMVAEIHIEIGGEVVRVVRQEIRTDKRDTKRRVTAR